MKQEKMKLGAVPAILWGEPSDQIYLFVHGQAGYKEEAESFARIVAEGGWQVLSIDLPEHGERKDEKNAFNPWHVIPELQMIMQYLKAGWKHIALRANSIGAMYCMISFREETLEQALWVSPILNMEHLIENMMMWANVTEDELKEQKEIPTDFGQTLSWEYLSYIREHRIEKWMVPTEILYGTQDNMQEQFIMEQFAKQFDCGLTFMKDGEHWFHTAKQLEVLNDWTRQKYLHMKD